MFLHVFQAPQIKVVSKETRSHSSQGNDKHTLCETWVEKIERDRGKIKRKR